MLARQCRLSTEKCTITRGLTDSQYLEGGILFSVRLPILILREPAIRGCAFAIGTSEVFMQSMPSPPNSAKALDQLDSALQTCGRAREDALLRYIAERPLANIRSRAGESVRHCRWKNVPGLG